MEIPRDAVLLRVFVGESDRTAGRALHRAIVEAAFKAKLAGATVFHGPFSYGHGDRINDESCIDAPGNLPTIVEIIDTEEKIEAFLPKLNAMMGTGLVTLEKVQMMRVGRLTKGATGKPVQRQEEGRL
jgi:PII-like signaling protein